MLEIKKSNFFSSTSLINWVSNITLKPLKNLELIFYAFFMENTMNNLLGLLRIKNIFQVWKTKFMNSYSILNWQTAEEVGEISRIGRYSSRSGFKCTLKYNGGDMHEG